MNKLFLLISLFVATLATAQAQITAPTKAEIKDGEYEYAQYLESLPIENGYVIIERIVNLPEGINTNETFAKMGEWIERCMKDDRIINHGPIECQEPYTLRHLVQQRMIFSSALLATDFAEFQFCLELRLKGNQIIFRMLRMNYIYNGDNPDRKMLRRPAEDYIADKVAMNKSKTKLVLAFRKFRVKTLDLADEYAESLKNAFAAK